MTDRRHRYYRDPTPPSLALTPRDERCLLALYEHRLLTSEQLGEVVGWSHTSHRNARLRKHFDAALVERVRGLTLGGTVQPVYLLGEAAVALIARLTGESETRIRTRLRDDSRLATGLSLQHELEANAVRIRLTTAIAVRSDLHLERWWNDHDAFDRWGKHTLRPDGFWKVWYDNLAAGLFFEHDRGHTSLERWKGRVARYLEYRDSGAFTRRHLLTKFRVVTTTRSPGRLRELREATRLITDRSFHFAVTADVLRDRDLTAPIWHSVTGHEPRALFPPKGAARDALVLR